MCVCVCACVCVWLHCDVSIYLFNYNICFIMWEEVKYVCLAKLDVGRTLKTSGATFARKQFRQRVAVLARSSASVAPCGHVNTWCSAPSLRLLQVCSPLSPGKGHVGWLGETPVLPLPQHRGLSAEGVPTKCKLPSLLFLGDGGLNFRVKYFCTFPSKGERAVNSSVPIAITNILSVLYRLTPQTLFVLQY